MKVGDKVRFNEDVDPAYLKGQIGEILKIDDDNYLPYKIKFDNETFFEEWDRDWGQFEASEFDTIVIESESSIKAGDIVDAWDDECSPIDNVVYIGEVTILGSTRHLVCDSDPETIKSVMTNYNDSSLLSFDFYENVRLHEESIKVQIPRLGEVELTKSEIGKMLDSIKGELTNE
jgi:hypothetical protein